jgi:light-regulated signal transduction histidine kinase (bacteriophytochrome)
MASTSASPDNSLKAALARVAELEAALRVSEQAAQTAHQELQHFVYAASHDLQEPLRAVTTYCQLLDRLYSDDEQAREFTGFITAGAARMNALLHGLLSYSRVNMSPLLTTVNLAAAVHSALFKLAPVIKETGAVIRFADLPAVTAHEIQMGQLFEQIISNSLLFRRQTPQIDIVAEESTLDGEVAQIITIKDNGLGIGRQFLAQVLQPFKRLHSKDVPGNGLGLAICEKIMRAHHGRIWLESDGATGTTVFLAFPL